MTNKQRLAKLVKAEALLKRTKDGYPGPGKGTFWEPALSLLHEVKRDLAKPPSPPVIPKMVFPIAADTAHVYVGGLHETSGVPGNWAIDFICHAGLGMVAPESGRVTRFSGHDPSDDQADAMGVYGWTTWIQTADAYLYFITHQGRRYPTLRIGAYVDAGDLIGYVGDQRFRPDHAHVGVTSPRGAADAKAHILRVSRSPRVS